jgi:hypothetical protein
MQVLLLRSMAASAAASAFRSHLTELMAAKEAGGDTSGVASCGAALLLALRAAQTEALLAAAEPAAGASAAKRRVEASEEEMLGLQYQRSRAACGIAEARLAAGTLRLPDGLVTAEEAAAAAAAGGATVARDSHQVMLQRLVVEHDERIRLGAEREAVQLDKSRRASAAASHRALASASRAQLDGFLFAAQALSKELPPVPPPAADKHGGAAAAAQLPEPLFCLWRAASALLSAWEGGGLPTGSRTSPAGNVPVPTLSIEPAPQNSAATAGGPAAVFAPGPLAVALRGVNGGVNGGAALYFTYHEKAHLIGVVVGEGEGGEMERSLRSLFPGAEAGREVGKGEGGSGGGEVELGGRVCGYRVRWGRRGRRGPSPTAFAASPPQPPLMPQALHQKTLRSTHLF